MPEQIKPNIDDVINSLAQQVAALSAEKAALQSIIKQYQQEKEIED